MAVVELADSLRPYSGFLPGLAVSVVFAVLVGRRVGRLLGGGWAIGFGLILSLGLVLSATVTPSHEAFVNGVAGSGTCDLSRGLPTLEELAWPGEALLNILLVVPLGLVIAFCRPSRIRALLVVGAFALPFAVELLQYRVTRLGRQCQSADVVDNLIGLGVGLAIGLALAAAARLVGRLRQRGLRGDPAS